MPLHRSPRPPRSDNCCSVAVDWRASGWGSLYAVVLGVLYIPVYQRWARETGTLIADEVRRQMPDDQSLRGTAGFRSAEMSLTRELNVRLRMGGALASFQGSFAVLAPVIAGAIASLFGG